MTSVETFEMTQSLPHTSDATDADTHEAAKTDDSSAVQSMESSLGSSDASALSAAASVLESTESSLETSQLSQVTPETGPEEITDFSSDATGASALSTSDVSVDATDATTLSDVTIDNAQSDAVTQESLVDISTASESASSLSFPQATAQDNGNVADNSESSPSVSDGPSSAILTVMYSSSLSFTEEITQVQGNGTEANEIPTNQSPSVSDESSSAILTIMNSSALSFTEVVTQVQGNGTEVNETSTNESGAATNPSSTVVDEHSEWHTERNLTDIMVTSTTPETTATTLRSRKTPRSRLPITERTRKPLPWSRLKVPNEKSLVCAITEDFRSYWLSFGFPFRYADVYPDHLCTHYIFSALVFDEFDETDFSLYPHNFCECSPRSQPVVVLLIESKAS
ncbi:dentin sialophosphoprotein-like [Dermacentor silvarum]|uniref:dentin sialophosphoprotein-like n=1 Tax=Dermacentor silvarum TaxID=543639 RepID=UPI0021019E2E|nr:dentin sialophosphoprotein-like [Dermacentor silvarum]